MKKPLISLALLGLLTLATLARADATTTFGPVSFSAALGTSTTAMKVYDQANITVQLNGITGTVGLKLQGSLDGNNWYDIFTEKVGSAASGFVATAGTGAVSLTMTANGIYSAPMAGFTHARVIAHYITSGVVGVQTSFGWGPTSQRGTIATTPTP